MDCGRTGTVVATSPENWDEHLGPRVALPLEPSVYDPPGLTCRDCEAKRFKAVLPERGICPRCGKPNRAAIKDDLGVTRSFCGDACITGFLNDAEGL